MVGDMEGDAPWGSGRLPNQPVDDRGLARALPGEDCGDCAQAGETVGLEAHVRAIVSRLHALCGVLEGHLSRAKGVRGDCLVWGSGPYLWGMSAPAMGLKVAGGFGSPAFLTFLRSCHPEVPRVGPAPPRHQRAESFPRGFPHVVAVLTDSASLAGALVEEAAASNGPGHFEVWRYPHLFPARCEDRTTPVPPLGWASSRTRVAHPAVGGATDAVWDIIV